MDNVNIFDVVVVSLIAILGLKGLMSGFFKEAFGLIGIVGGVYLGSRYATPFGEWISTNVYMIENQNLLTLSGFVVVLMSFWIAMILAGKVVGSMMKLSGLGGMDKTLGFVFGVGKIFVIASVIVYALMNIAIVKTNVSRFTENSFMVPILQDVGSKILKIDLPFETPKIVPSENVDDTNQSDKRMTLDF